MLKRFIQDNLTLANDALFSNMLNYSVKNSAILAKKNPFSYTQNVLLVKANNILTLKNSIWKSYILTDDVELTASNLDIGSTFQVGQDYYVYLVDDGTQDGKFLISLNTTYPQGYVAENSRKIGGFHYGHIRAVSEDWVPVDTGNTKYGNAGDGWQKNVTVGIVPNSVWDLGNRPQCAPEGMVKVGHLWMDIYQASAAEDISVEGNAAPGAVVTGKLQSKYGQFPVTGTEKLTWYSFQELASRIGKRLPTYGEWIKGAFGNPGGQDNADDYGWTKTSNTGRARTGCRVDNANGNYSAGAGIKPYAISAHNLVDCVGNVWEWLDELSYREDGANTGWAYRDCLGTDKGRAYLYKDNALVALLGGGCWGSGVHCGSRSVDAHVCPWFVITDSGCRLACDSL